VAYATFFIGHGRWLRPIRGVAVEHLQQLFCRTEGRAMWRPEHRRSYQDQLFDQLRMVECQPESHRAAGRLTHEVYRSVGRLFDERGDDLREVLMRGAAPEL